MNIVSNTEAVNSRNSNSNNTKQTGAEGLEDLIVGQNTDSEFDVAPIMRRDSKTGTRWWQIAPKPVPVSTTGAAVAATRPEVPRETIRRYVELLTGSPDTFLCWRFLPERGSPEDQRIHDLEKTKRAETHNKRWSVQRNYDGSIDDVIEDMRDHQGYKWGVFVVVNEGGRKGTDIRRVRALFIDMDGKDLASIQFHTEPDFIVQRDAIHWHAYWLVADCPLVEFTHAQLRLARFYESDPAVIDLPRVLRVPGTRHYKDPDNPRDMVLHERRCGPARPFAEIMRGVSELPAESKSERPLSNAVGDPVTEANLIDLLHYVDPNVSYPEWRNMVAAIGATNLVGDESGERRREIADVWSSGEFWDMPVTRYGGLEAVELVLDTMPPKEGGVGFGTIVHIAKMGRYRSEPARPDFVETYRDHVETKRQLNDKAKTPDGLILLHGDRLQPKNIRWLWRHWIARSVLTMLAGPPETGKTTAAIQFAATVTIGGKWPDGTEAPCGDVLAWLGEDLPQETILPRFLACGGDPAKFHIIAGVKEGEQPRPFDPANDMQLLYDAAKALPNLQMIVIEPIVTAVRGDSHKNAETRRALQPIVYLAETLGVAVLGITHFTKGTAGKGLLDRVTGSLAFGAVTRLVIAFVMSPDGSKRRMMRAKTNIGPGGGGFDYGLSRVPLLEHDNIEGQRVDWGAAVHGSAQRLVADIEGDGKDQSPPINAVMFLRELLSGGEVEVAHIKKAGVANGYSFRTLERAKAQLGVKPWERAFGDNHWWVWKLPEAEPDAGTLDAEKVPF